ncbi:uncharacterized protein LOC131078634 [Cryptomeria japonica]|uniref:uncharacterized protein LOC131078634 n=1 Tax=Cryptomeria japonica TaxID=3369 RepID=UPI0027DA6F24|nr:uncharacterized protein LOC131078634 [Cryptomeria japonica]
MAVYGLLVGGPRCWVRVTWLPERSSPESKAGARSVTGSWRPQAPESGEEAELGERRRSPGSGGDVECADRQGCGRWRSCGVEPGGGAGRRGRRTARALRWTELLGRWSLQVRAPVTVALGRWKHSAGAETETDRRCRHRVGDKIHVWTPPDRGWTKINFDVASRGNPGISGAGVIARDEKGSILALGAKRLVDGTNNEAECQAAIEAILLAKKMEVKKIHLEGDSQLVVNGIARGKMEAWNLDKHIRRMNNLLNGFEDFKVSHVLREANVEADRLSNVGANGSLVVHALKLMYGVAADCFFRPSFSFGIVKRTVLAFASAMFGL